MGGPVTPDPQNGATNESTAPIPRSPDMTNKQVMTAAVDVVVIGGGIAGASLALALAREGLGVTVLEATVEFPDRVRGESMQAWGVREARRLGVEDVLMTAGAHIAPIWRQYFPSGDDPRDIPMNLMVPDVGGSLNLRHPDACQALLDAAAAAGAVVVRGVSKVRVPLARRRRCTTPSTDVRRAAPVVGRRCGRSTFGDPPGARHHVGAPTRDELHRRAAARRPRRCARRPRRA